MQPKLLQLVLKVVGKAGDTVPLEYLDLLTSILSCAVKDKELRAVLLTEEADKKVLGVSLERPEVKSERKLFKRMNILSRELAVWRACKSS